jgi:hypothetical protein
LIEQGYCVDCSVTPHVSWKTTLGDPNGAGGTDFSEYPESAYLIENKLLELPMTIINHNRSQLINKLSELPRIGRFIRHKFPQRTWLRPNRRNLKAMLKLVKQATAEKRPYIEFMIHSSELMPGGSPNFVNESQIEKLYEDMERLFAIIQQKGFVGMTLKDYYKQVTK